MDTFLTLAAFALLAVLLLMLLGVLMLPVYAWVMWRDSRKAVSPATRAQWEALLAETDPAQRASA